MKFCKDCKHCLLDDELEVYCFRKGVESERDVVTGETRSYYKPLSCYRERGEDGHCGEEATYFEQREEAPSLWKRIKTTLIGEKNNA